MAEDLQRRDGGRVSAEDIRFVKIPVLAESVTGCEVGRASDDRYKHSTVPVTVGGWGSATKAQEVLAAKLTLKVNQEQRLILFVTFNEPVLCPADLDDTIQYGSH